MSIALIVIAALLGVAAAISGLGKLRRMPQVVESMHSVGVTDRQIPLLAALELLGALGLLVGIWVPVIGIAAAIGLMVYFLGAVVSHLRAKAPVKEAAPALLLFVIACVTVVLEVLRG